MFKGALMRHYGRNIDLNRSEAKTFIVDPDNKNTIIPPFTTIDGLGENVAITVVEERKKRPFLSKQDLMNRTSLNGTHIKKLESYIESFSVRDYLFEVIHKEFFQKV